jgi:hypothetical protein
VTTLRAPTKADLLDEATNLVEILLGHRTQDGPLVWLNQALNNRPSADVIANANDRAGLRVADTWDYGSDLQQAIRELLALGVTPMSINKNLNRVIPRTDAQLARLARKRLSRASA